MQQCLLAVLIIDSVINKNTAQERVQLLKFRISKCYFWMSTTINISNCTALLAKIVSNKLVARKKLKGSALVLNHQF